jgi:tetratricopeptide (TPR) repeat protein
MFEPAAAVELLTRVAGPGQLAQQSPEASQIAMLCSYLPLALRITAIRFRAMRWQPREAVRRLETAPSRLSALSFAGRGISRTLAVSYHQLPPEHAKLFRFLSLLGGRDATALPAAAMLGVSRGSATEILDDLLAEHLLEPKGQDRYGYHDLVNEYARELLAAEAEDPVGVAAQDEALSRAQVAYLAVAAKAESDVRGLYRVLRRWEPPPAPDSIDVETEILLEGGAHHWFSVERLNLSAAAEMAAKAGHPELCWKLIDTLTNFLEWRGYYREWLRLRELSVKAAGESGDLHALAAALRDLGRVHWVLGDWSKAGKAIEESYDLFCEIGDDLWTAYVQVSRAVIVNQSGNRGRSIEILEGCLPIFRAEDPLWAATTLRHLADLHAEDRRFREAAKCAWEAISNFEQLGDIVAAAASRTTLADIYIAQGWAERALRELLPSLATLDGQQEMAWASATRRSIGRAYLALGRTQDSARELRAAASAFAELGDVRSTATVQLAEAEAAEQLGNHAEAEYLLTQALRTFTMLGADRLRAQTLVQLGSLAARIGDWGVARERYRQAHDLYTELDAAKAAEVARLLDTANAGH